MSKIFCFFWHLEIFSWKLDIVICWNVYGILLFCGLFILIGTYLVSIYAIYYSKYLVADDSPEVFSFSFLHWYVFVALWKVSPMPVYLSNHQRVWEIFVFNSNSVLFGEHIQKDSSLSQTASKEEFCLLRISLHHALLFSLFFFFCLGSCECVGIQSARNWCWFYFGFQTCCSKIRFQVIFFVYLWCLE